MDIGFVIGNGISRKNIDLNIIGDKGITYGCNWLYREFSPDVLIAVDPPVSKKIQVDGYAHAHLFYTHQQNIISNSGALPLSDIGTSERMNSGECAIDVALTLYNHTQIYLLGFDFTNESVYGTESTELPEFTTQEYFIQQHNNSNNTKFIRVVNDYSRYTPIPLNEISVREFLKITF